MKKLLGILLTFALVFTMSGAVCAAADGTSDISAYNGNTGSTQAEIMAANKSTIKKENGKWYYYNGKEKKDTGKGWKKNSSGKLAYYVGEKGYVTMKIVKSKKDGGTRTYKCVNGEWNNNETKYTANKKKIKKINGKCFYINGSGRVDRTKGWKKNSSGKLAYYVGKKGYVTAKIKDGEYYEWSKTALTKVNNLPKNKTVKKKGKWFYVNSKGKIDLTTGWKNEGIVYVNGGEAQVNKAVKIEGKTYYFDKNGSVKKLNDGWNGSVYVKNGEPVIGTTVQVDGFYNTFDNSGNRVSYAVKNGKIVRSDNGKSVSKTGAYKIGSGSNKDIYYCTKSDGTYQTSGSVTIDGKTYEVKSTGICVLHEVHQWSPLDENGQFLEDTDKKTHAAKTEIQDVKVKDAWDEEIKEYKTVCRTCGAYFTVGDTKAWKDHVIKTNHGNCENKDVVVNTIPHEAVYEKQKVTVEEAWEEHCENYRCMVCGETMKIRVIEGKDSKGKSRSVWIPEKGGYLLTVRGNVFMRVSGKSPLPGNSDITSEKISADESYKKYGFSYLGKYESDNTMLDSDYLLLLKDHNIAY